ncbi:MaoC family dehydratase [Chelatococcus sambhunathii]|uniref:MaoC family dehydratase n=1 Tax=Chelatococcus sambhunathii TaxID=363953 RepID=A0ABU1DKP2_9HYPH|nr:MaoC family dehydratase [Chelatococcus sambhunathii]MDR4308682.1 MaoC family dehydratase [Chelatococcus sambhunathii]
MYLEDYEVGAKAEIGSYLFTADEIVRFAKRFDPQPFHLSEEAGLAGPFKGLAASGWHTCAIWMKLMVAYQIRMAKERMAAGLPVGRAGPSPGFTDLRWRVPVMAGDTLTYFASVLETRPSASRPGWGLLTGLNSAVNQNGVEAFRFTSAVFVERRPG